MEQTELLWQYQQADMEADALDNEMKRDPTRLALKKNREFLVEQQNTVKRMQQEIADMADRVEVITLAVSRLEDQLRALRERLTSAPPETLEQAKEFNRDAQKLAKDLEDFKKEMSRIQSDATEREQKEKEIRVRFNRVKADYEKQRVAYDEKYKRQLAQLEEKRAAAAARSKDIDAELLERYKTIKQHCVSPVAKLFGNQCGGCNMSLPQATLRKMQNGAKIVECETCGRMLI